MKTPAASPHLDMRNVMWLLAAMVFVVAPHIPRLPAWVGFFCLAVSPSSVTESCGVSS